MYATIEGFHEVMEIASCAIIILSQLHIV